MPQRRVPGRIKAQILDAAVRQFTAKGLSGARVDEIAGAAGANKRMIYHYFGNKEDLWLAALEVVYAALRERELTLELDHLPPEQGMRVFVRTTWRHFLEHPEFVSLVNTENLHQARYLRRSKRILDMHSPLVGKLVQLLQRGAGDRIFRDGIDPVQLYISIAALGYFYLSNRHTLSTVFAIELDAPEELERREEHIVDVILSFVRRPLEDGARRPPTDPRPPARLQDHQAPG